MSTDVDQPRVERLSFEKFPKSSIIFNSFFPRLYDCDDYKINLTNDVPDDPIRSVRGRI